MMEHLWLYAVLVFGIVVLPGMDMAFVLASALTGGRASGFAAVGGLIAGGFAHAAMSALGIGLLLRLFPAAFNALLLAGSVYVAWMGVGLLRGAGSLVQVQAAQARPLAQTFWRAMATCLLNPKAYIFMLAVFPQFLRPEQGALALQVIALALIGGCAQFVVYGTVALSAAGVRTWLSGSARSQVWFGRAVGLLLIATAAWTVMQGWRAV